MPKEISISLLVVVSHDEIRRRRFVELEVVDVKKGGEPGK